ncbi:hypothetical protein KXW37_004302, partial [Aspergillus fumigatus]
MAFVRKVQVRTGSVGLVNIYIGEVDGSRPRKIYPGVSTRVVPFAHEEADAQSKTPGK